MKKLITISLVLAMALTLCACGSKLDERYTTLIECLDNHDYKGAAAQVAALRQAAIDNGDIVVHEPQEEDYTLVNRYRSIVNFLNNYTPTGYYSLLDPTTGEHPMGNDALALAYSELQTLEGVDEWLSSDYFTFEEGFPTDRTALLSRFSVVENRLYQTKRITRDNMGNENETEGRQWFYDADGTLIGEYISWNDSSAVWENLYSKNGYYHYTYNAAGQISETKITNQEATDVYAIVVPAYDAAGNLISETITDNDGQHVFTYTYDDNGNRIQMDYSDSWNNYAVLYFYDEANQLIRKERHTLGNYHDVTYTTYQVTTVYNYDASGKLTDSTITTQSFNTTYSSGYSVNTNLYYEMVDTVAYSYDSNGTLIREVKQCGDRVYTSDNSTEKPEYSAVTIDYCYGSYYLFN